MAKLPKAPFFQHFTKRDEPHESHVGDVTLNLQSRVEEFLGFAGRLLSQSKSGYDERHPEHEVFFNACIFDAKTEEQIWFGDLDLTLSEEEIQKVANLVGDIWVTPEQPFRFEGLKKGLQQERRMARQTKDDIWLRSKRYRKEN